MPSVRSGAIHLFRLAGVDVFLHWSWFLVAAYEIQARDGRYSSVTWSIAEYLALFLIVLTHEFGHAMACRQAMACPNSCVSTIKNSARYSNTFQATEEYRPFRLSISMAATRNQVQCR